MQLAKLFQKQARGSWGLCLLQHTATLCLSHVSVPELSVALTGHRLYSPALPQPPPASLQRKLGFSFLP